MQMDSLHARIQALEAKNKEYLDRLAGQGENDRQELLRETKMARKSVGVEDIAKLVDETLDEIAQKEQMLQYLRAEIEEKNHEL